MFGANKRFMWVCIITLSIGCLICLRPERLSSEILLRHTLEDYQGTLEELGWQKNDTNGVVMRGPESDNQYQTQLHGGKSLYIYDPDDTSYANARHEFPSL